MVPARGSTVAAPPQVRFFKSVADLRRWFARNGERERELWVGFYRKDSGRANGIT